MRLTEITPAEALARRAEFEPQIRAVYDGKVHQTDCERLLPFRLGGTTGYGKAQHFYTFDIHVVKFQYIIAAHYPEYSDNERNYLAEFYAWTFWKEQGVNLPREIEEAAEKAFDILAARNEDIKAANREKEEAEKRELVLEIFNEMWAERRDEVCAYVNAAVAWLYGRAFDMGAVPSEGRIVEVAEIAVVHAYYGKPKPETKYQLEPLSAAEIEKMLLTFFKTGKREASFYWFRGRRISWKINERARREAGITSWSDNKTDRTQKQYLIVWGGVEYEQENFFKAAFGDDYKKFPMKARFNVENVRLLSRNQWVKLQYQTLAANYTDEIPYIHDTEAKELKEFYSLQSGTNQSFNTKIQRMTWFGGDGLRYMVAFGQGHDGREKAAADRLFCYKQSVSDNTAYYEGRAQSLLGWVQNVLFQADLKRDALGVKFSVDDCEDIYNAVQMYLHYQEGYYMTFPGDVSDAVGRVVRDYVNAQMDLRYRRKLVGKEVESLEEYLKRELGEYCSECAAEGVFSVRLKADENDVEIVENREIKKDMAAYNKERGAAQMEQRAAQDLSGFRVGERITTKELAACGFSRQTTTRLVKAGVLKRVIPGVYILEKGLEKL